VTHSPFNANATVRWVSRWDAFPFHPLLVRTLKFATNDNGNDHGLAIGSAMNHPPATTKRILGCLACAPEWFLVVPLAAA